MSDVVIFSHEEGREVDGVVDKIRAAGLEIRRFNLCRFPHALTFRLAKLQSALSSNLSSGWFHNTGEYSFAKTLTGIEREVALRECDAMIDGVLARHDCNWFNAPVQIRACSNKPNQLLLAEKLGIPVPDYVITNDIEAVRELAAKHSKLVMKALAVSFMHYGPGDGWKFFTRDVEYIEALAEELAFAPQIYQQKISRREEIRVTVVDGKCFSIGINCQGLPKEIVDIRELDYAMERKRFFVPAHINKIEEWSKKFVAAMQLGYAGLDWAIDFDGTPYFLEANACGAFKWFEQCGAGDITGAIATALLDRCA